MVKNVKYSKKGKKATASKKVVKKAIKKANNKVFATKVKNVVKKMAETKIATTVQYDEESIILPDITTSPPQAPTTIYDLTEIWDTIEQGAGQGDRIGCKINPTKFTFKGYITLSSDKPGDKVPMVIRMLILRKKNTVDPDQYPSPYNVADLFQFGNTVIAPQNKILDSVRDINKNDWILYASRTFKMGGQTYDASGNALNPNNGFVPMKKFSINLLKHCKKIVYQDDNPASAPNPVQNHRFIMLFVGGRADGEPLTNTVFQSGFDFSGLIEGRYKDM